MEPPVITTIIPTFRRPFLLKKALDSILNQSFPHFQVIICDNCSQDETHSLIASYTEKDPRVHYICHPENIGMMKNYEFGFGLIKTPYFHFLSDDDTIAPDFFSEALDIFQKHSDIGFYAGSTQIVSPDNEVIRIPHSHWKKEGYWPSQEGALEMIGKYPIPTSVMFSQKILESLQPDFSNVLHWDCDFLLHIALAFPFYLSKTLSGSFLSQDSSFSKAPPFIQSYDSFLKINHRIEQLSFLSPLFKEEIGSLLKKDFRLHFRSTLLRLLKQKDFASCEKALHSLETIYGKDFAFFAIFLRIGKTFPPLCNAIDFLQRAKRSLRI